MAAVGRLDVSPIIKGNCEFGYLSGSLANRTGREGKEFQKSLFIYFFAIMRMGSTFTSQGGEKSSFKFGANLKQERNCVIVCLDGLIDMIDF